jgi:glutamate N-acetyltransferase / amino-acid N-acetyltransferase
VRELPLGFAAHVANIGVKDGTDDFVVLTAERRVPAAGVFTRSRFAGPSVVLSRRHLEDGCAQAIVIVSKNANVANGQVGFDDARDLVEGVAARLGCAAEDVLVASTGVIGRRYPMDRIRDGIAAMPRQPSGRSADDAARGIMTTDTVAKVTTAAVGRGPA